MTLARTRRKSSRREIAVLCERGTRRVAAITRNFILFFCFFFCGWCLCLCVCVKSKFSGAKSEIQSRDTFPIFNILHKKRNEKEIVRVYTKYESTYLLKLKKSLWCLKDLCFLVFERFQDCNNTTDWTVYDSNFGGVMVRQKISNFVVCHFKTKKTMSNTILERVRKFGRGKFCYTFSHVCHD